MAGSMPASSTAETTIRSTPCWMKASIWVFWLARSSCASWVLSVAPISAAAFLAPFGGRLLALSAAHELLVQNGWRGILLDEVVTRAWADVEGTMAIRVEIDGPRVLLGPDVAQNVMLGAHELVAAAAAAEQPPEQVLVSWALLPDGGFRLDWRMLGTSSIQVSGFGQRLLRTVLPVVLGGEVTALGISDAGFAYGIRGRIGPQLQLAAQRSA